MSNKQYIIGALIIASSQPALAEKTSQEIYDFMQAFHQNPKEVMEILPTHSQPSKWFTDDEITSGDFIEIKDQYRQQLMQKNSGLGFSSTQSNDNPKYVLDNPNTYLNNIYEIDQQIPRRHRLAMQPWSDSYWPIYSGGLAYRYADSDLRQTSPQNWQEYADFSKITKPVEDYIGYAKRDLSPAEKYDLLMGDNRSTLANKNWNVGQSYYDRTGSVERWMGYCHGWAAAAYNLSRPKKTVTVKDAAGENLTFYPADIKALGTLLWSSASFDMGFIGGRCNTKNPQKDENGRTLDQNCFDNNPGSWHTTILNQIGLNERSIIMDATYDYQVWNQPILSYSVTYFNPQTGYSYANLDDAIIDRADYLSDKFVDYRSPSTSQFVGVKMSVQYIVETSPTHRNYDDSRYDSISQVTYHYDLELASNGKILGGEWYGNRHPDFLWAAKKGTKARSRYNGSGVWAEGQSVPVSWHSPAVKASKYNQPLSSVVEELFKRSSGK